MFGHGELTMIAAYDGTQAAIILAQEAENAVGHCQPEMNGHVPRDLVTKTARATHTPNSRACVTTISATLAILESENWPNVVD